MDFFASLAHHTPPAMLLAVALIIWRGYRFTRTRVRPIRTYLLLPIIFMIWGLLHVVIAAQLLDLSLATLPPAPILGFLAALLIAAPLGWISINQTGFAIDHQRKLARLPGSWVPILRYLLVFIVNYTVSIATQFHLLPPGTLILLAFAVSGFMIGYFGIWTARFRHLYQSAPQTDLSLPSRADQPAR